MFCFANLLSVNFMLDFITKWGSFDVLQSKASVYYKVEHFCLLQSRGSGVTKYDS